jgi:hypothetical protein
VKACESLAESGKIKEKVYGKQKVYVADQSQFPEVCLSSCFFLMVKGIKNVLNPYHNI